jgi:SAM-dependent methyltransferase
MSNPDESVSFWISKPPEVVAEVVAELHRQRRVAEEVQQEMDIAMARRTVADFFIRGKGIEVGAGDRPFPMPAGATCFYGDILDGEALKTYFASESGIVNEGKIDAQTFSGISDGAFDFVISAHVIEHLENPIGGIRSAIRILKPHGTLILVVPDRRYTFDRLRPPTPLDHLTQDEQDGGEGTRLITYLEHIQYIHPQFSTPVPEDEIMKEATRLAGARMDTHFHCWDRDEFAEVVKYVLQTENAELAGMSSLIVNENIFVLRKLPPISAKER